MKSTRAEEQIPRLPDGSPPFAPLSRRRLVEVGAMSVAALALPDLLHARAAAAPPASRPTAASCLFIVQYGGCSHIDTFDPKPDAPADVRGPYRPISAAVPGIRLTEMLPELAKLAGRYTLVRSMSHGTLDHDGGMHVCMTGHSKPARDVPYFGSVAARVRPSAANVPSYVWLQNLDRDVDLRYLQGGFLGAPYGPLRVGTNEDNPAAADFRFTGFDPPPGLSPERLAGRRRLVAAVEARGAAAEGDGYRRAREHAFDLVAGAAARRAFDVGCEPAPLRERYGRNPLGQNLLLARRLIEAGVRLVSVNAWMGYPPGDRFLVTQGWDMHGAEVQGGGIFGTNQFGLGFALPRFDQALSTLLRDLEDRGLLESTLVVVVGEFGRTPKITSSPYPGRDHWPQCYSALLAGGGIRGGSVYGASDREGAYPDSAPVSPEDFGATLFHALGIPPETKLAPDGFTRPVSPGQPVMELFG